MTTRQKLQFTITVMAIMLGTISASAADDIKNQFNPITTGVT